MGDETVRNRFLKKRLERILQNVLDIFEADDGKSFEEKKALAIRMLTKGQVSLTADIPVDKAKKEESAARIRESFWRFGKEIRASDKITIREVCASDREPFLELRKIYSLTKAVLENEVYQSVAWHEHTKQTSLMFTILHEGNYAGYCGIQDLTKEVWEISIELLPEKTGKGIGFSAISAMLNGLRDRLGVRHYRVRIEPTNCASQGLFEKLGAVPNGLSEPWQQNPEDLTQLEQENMSLLDENIFKVAAKFSVEPHSLLSHVLEYTLMWT